MKKIIFFFLGVVFLITMSLIVFSNTYCYQESANTSNQTGTDGSCNQNYTGAYNATTLLFYVNYTKPNNVNLVGAIWYVGHGGNNASQPFENVTIPASCYNVNSTKLQLRVRSTFTANSLSQSIPMCYNGTWVYIGSNYTVANCGAVGSVVVTNTYSRLWDGDWTNYTIYRATGTWDWMNASKPGQIWEEGMFWNISNLSVTQQNTFINATYSLYSFIVYANVSDVFGAASINMTNISSTNGTCINYLNITNGNMFSSRWNCTSTDSVLTNISIGFMDNNSNFVGTPISSNFYPNPIPIITVNNTFINVTPGHSFIVYANVTHIQGATAINMTNISSTNGVCVNYLNVTSGNIFSSRWNCTGTSYTSSNIIIGFMDIFGHIVFTPSSSNNYSNIVPKTGIPILSPTNPIISNTLQCAATIATDYCYQESANTTNQSGTDGNCGLDYSGAYNATGLNPSFPYNQTYDGDWSTKGSFATLSINYTKPPNALNSSIWTVKHPGQTIYNITIPNACWNYSNTKLLFKFYAPVSDYFWACYNGTNWQDLCPSPTAVGFIYEEAMWWNTTVTDIDNDTITYFYDWYNSSNNSTFSSMGINNINLSSGNLTLNKFYECSILASDSFSNSSWFNSSSVRVNSCGYSGSGIWNLNCSDNCTFTTSQTIPSGNNVSVTGNGRLTFNNGGKWLFTGTNQYISIASSCTIGIYSGGGFDY